MAEIQRRKTSTATIDGVRVGSSAPIMVQSMTNTDTADVPGTIKQVAALARAGSEVVRVTAHSVSGDVNLRNVTGPSIEVNSGGGRITYVGDPGPVGEYLLTSHSGDLDVSIPASALVDIKARSIKGQADPGFPEAAGASARVRCNMGSRAEAACAGVQPGRRRAKVRSVALLIVNIGPASSCCSGRRTSNRPRVGSTKSASRSSPQTSFISCLWLTTRPACRTNTASKSYCSGDK